MPINSNIFDFSKPIEDAFLSIGYKRNLIKRNYPFSDFISPKNTLRTVDIAVFGREPMDYRTSCFGLKFATNNTPSAAIVNDLRAFGAPQMFIIKDTKSELWVNRENESILHNDFLTEEIPKIIQSHKNEWNPNNVIRLKSGFSKPTLYQTDFIDIGLLPALEHQASSKIDILLNRILNEAEEDYKNANLSFQPSSIFSIVFRLLTAKLLNDRDITTNPEVDFSQPLISLDAVSRYYGDLSPINIQSIPIDILNKIADKISKSFSLRNLSVDTLTYVYENTFVSQKSRRDLGIHSTPSYVADYVLSQMPLEELPTSEWHTLDPMCGHGIFLIAAMRRMQDLLPLDWSGQRRHAFFTDKLKGIDIEPFAIEVAKLCLTLADFPQPDGWNLEITDFFDGKTSSNALNNTNIVVGNPPFENIQNVIPLTPKPKELLNRILPSLKTGSLLGLVLPLSVIDGNGYKPERKQLNDSFEILNITTLPDRIFQYSDAETAILIARKSRPTTLSRVNFRHVREPDREKFRLRNSVTFEDVVPTSYFKNNMQGRYFVPPFRELWEFLERNPKLSDVAEIKTGVEYELGIMNRIPNEIISNEPFPGGKRGIFNISEGFMQFATNDIVYMSTKPEHRRMLTSGAWDLPWHKPKVIVPKSVLSRGPWRFAAVIDKSGLIARRRFFAIWPKEDNLSAEFIAAILNSPIAQLYAYSHGNKRDLPKRVYSAIPIPNATDNEREFISEITKEYLELNYQSKFREAKNKLIEIDSSILSLYNLPIRLEKPLIRFFAHDIRRVPFKFLGYKHDLISSKKTPKDQLEKQFASSINELSIPDDLGVFLRKSFDIICQSFTLVRDVFLLIEQDPETDEKWVLIDIGVDGDIEDILNSYDDYVKKWTSKTTSDIRENIRLSYRII